MMATYVTYLTNVMLVWLFHLSCDDLQLQAVTASGAWGRKQGSWPGIELPKCSTLAVVVSGSNSTFWDGRN
jgi:hypothetical protein